jgi:4-amino-4-deoxy-L-arabinose transferase-like glycosyltransferase
MQSIKNILLKFFFPAVLIAISSLLIFYDFPNIPRNIAIDEAEFIILSKHLENSPYTPYSQLATGHATLYFYMLLVSINIFGESAFGVRIISAVFGVINTVLIYYIMKLVFESRKNLRPVIREFMPFLIAFSFVSMRWYFNFARFGFEATTVLFFELLAVLTLFIYRKKRHLWILFLVGIFSGLAYNSYTPGRLFFILPLVFIIYEFESMKQLSKNLGKPLLYFLIPFLIIILPLNLYFTQYDDNRIYELFYLQSELLTIQEKINFTWQNITSVFGMFFLEGDHNGRHNFPYKPMLNPIQIILFAVGLLVTLKNWRNYFNAFFLLYFVVGIIPPLLTYPWENPNSLRAATVLPSLAYFMGQGIMQLFRIPLKKRFWLYCFFIIISISAIYEARTYFVFQRKVFDTAFEITPEKLEQHLKGRSFTK